LCKDGESANSVPFDIASVTNSKTINSKASTFSTVPPTSTAYWPNHKKTDSMQMRDEG